MRDAPPATLLPWLGVVAVAATGLAATSPVWRGGAAVALLVAATCAGAIHWRVDRRRAGALRELAAHLRTATAPHAPLTRTAPTARSELRDGVRAVSNRVRRLEGTLVTLAEDRDRLFAVLEGMGEGVLAVGRDERVLLVNRSAAALLRLDPAAATGRPVWEVVRRTPVREAGEAVLGGAVRYEAEFDGPAGAALALRADPLPGVAPVGGAGGVVVQVRDVTELRRLEAVRQEFVANVSHELKTPVAAISAMAETLADRLPGAAPDGPPALGRFASQIGEQADRLHRLIVDLLRLARVEAGRETFDVGRVAVGPVVADCVRRHRAVAEARGVRLSEDGPPHEVFVTADAAALGTALDNLLDNALAHTPAGGRVTVGWTGPDPGESGRVTIDVTDTGVGIPPGHLGRVFERFHRVDAARNRDAGGTGLGLAIVKHLVALFGGAATVKSETGPRLHLHPRSAVGVRGRLPRGGANRTNPTRQ